MKKAKFLIVSLLVIFTSISAQNNLGTIFYSVKDYELAKKYFQQKLTENQAEAFYYLGEIAFAEGNLEEAANFYNKGMQTNVEPYCRIGMAKIDLKNGKKSEALATFLSVQKKYSGDIDILAAIGYAYLDNKLHQEVQDVLKDMLKIKKENPKIHVLEGDMLRAEDKIGDAAGKYETAIYFDAKFDLARIKLVEVYERSSWQIAIETLNELLDKNPNYILSYRYLGRIYTNNGYYLKAIEAYKAFFDAGYYSLDDIAKFVQALFFNKNYDDANEKIKEGLAIAPDHFVLNRLRMYVAAYNLNIEEGLNYAKYFFSLRKENATDYIALDYSTYALLLKEAKMYDDAIEQYKKAFLLDATLVDNFKEMATIANLKAQKGVAGDYLKTYIEKKGADKVEITDYYYMGTYYYIASTVRNATDTAIVLKRYYDVEFLNAISGNELQIDSIRESESLFIEKSVKYYQNQAEKAFDEVIKRNPASYLGYLWKARTNSLMDPDSEAGLAKPYYEKTIEVLVDKEEKSKAFIDALVEAYRYLAYQYFIKNDFPTTRIYCEKILELDMENSTAIELLKAIKK
jgi:tetratricopeptide (TPR) repeat protein